MNPTDEAGWLEEPSPTVRDPLELLLGYLDYYRDVAVRKIDGLTEDELRSSRLPSSWTPLGLVRHLAFMERRWLVWGFAGEQLPAPWGDHDPGRKRWIVADDLSFVDVVSQLRATGVRTREITSGSSLDAIARTGGRFAVDREPPRLGWILLHVLQEYARHIGHLDVARELVDSAVGE
jgi:Protein of unknown function (DUF664)